ELIIREFSFHQLNANLLWPGTFAFAEWLVQHRSCIDGRRVIELGSGTGALAIFLRKSYNLDITTSDYDDQEIEENIAHNCRANEIPVIPHIKHTWGDKFPNSDPGWDLIIAILSQVSLPVFDGRLFDNWRVKMLAVFGFQDVIKVVTFGFAKLGRNATEEQRLIFKQ
ncbi:hypothetical protein CR513_27765, partial [Mucuna pruriens]